MTTAKYWNGTSWEILAGAGGTPLTKTMPVRPQRGSVMAVGTTDLPHFIAPGPGAAYDLPPGWITPGGRAFYERDTRVLITCVLNVGGTGTADTATFGQLVSAHGYQIGTSSQTTFTHAFYWTSSVMCAEIYCPQGGSVNNAFKVAMHFVGGGDIHTQGCVLWKVVCV